jgi:hypothetical protein
MAYTQGPGGSRSTLNITTGTVIKAAQGTIWRVFVNTAPSVAGGVYDAATAGAATAATLIANVPTTAGPVEIIAPAFNGIYVNPGTGGVVSVTWD